MNGLSGFPNPAESEYDQFSVGHAGTSIATAIGMALGEQQQKHENKIVAIGNNLQHDSDFSLKYESTMSFNIGKCVIHRLFFFVSPE